MRPLLLLLLALPLAAQPRIAGASGLRIQIERLSRLGRVLHIAAHPDDENTAFLAFSARGWQYRTGYLSLTRGEGGQNLIGSEQGEWMGLIRTQELLAARRIDGAEQYFSRAIDFGFTKTAAETLTKWDRETILGDVVYVIRKFQPDIVVLRFSGTPRDGHGQHQASSILGREAFAAAADPARFPGTLPPWKAKRLLLNIPAFTPAMAKEAEQLPDKIVLNVGVYDPVLGYSFGEIAGVSRSQHRSQAMGWREERGQMREYFQVFAGEPASSDLMEGIDTTWARVPHSEKAAALLQRAAQELDDRAPHKIVPLLQEARRELNRLSGSFVEEKRAELDNAILAAAGLFLDVTTPKYHAVLGSPLDVAFTAINRGPLAVEWRAALANGKEIAVRKTLPQGVPVSQVETFAAPAVPTQPYWLQKPKGETMYELADRTLLDSPDGPAANGTTGFVLSILGETQIVRRPVQHRYTDRLYGELTRPLVAVPPAVVRFSDRAILFPEAKAHDVAVQVTAMDTRVTGTVRLNLPAGWSAAPASQEFQLAATEQQTFAFSVTPPAAAETAIVKAEAIVNGIPYALSMTTVDYPHIPPQSAFTPAEARVVRADVRTLSKHVGYIMGSGDEVPRALEQLGCQVTVLTKEALAQEDLSKYDAIVTGVRAFNTRADVRANARRLHEYAHNGGTLVVQYNVMEGGFFGGNPKLLEGIGPYPITLSQARVTVEQSPVEFAATHPLLAGPNRIVARDFDGWVQERGLYFASTWDPKYETLFQMHDPGEKPLSGGTLYAAYGRGAYVFTPLSWFRQLPAGVPGAYRIFANFLSAGKKAQ
ncbi:MAG TPA: PIG-L family deacetylase [Bryobacteraceae bacterium]|nr:PIG-L family deacetylase [Bryobacteraceae bacterium]